MFIALYKVPASILLTLTVPVVDHEKPNDNWNKWLSVLHCVTAPLFFVLVTKCELTFVSSNLNFLCYSIYTAEHIYGPILHSLFL